VAVGWSTFFIPFLFVLEPSLLMQGGWTSILWNFSRNMLGIFVGTAAAVGFAFAPLSNAMRLGFGAVALAILIPPNAFSGAEMLDWIGLATAALLLGFHYLHGRKVAAQAAAPS
jgi:TRAP-type uncharacterized transport system fused permease subunit